MKQPVWQSSYFKRIFGSMLIVTSSMLLLAVLLLYASFQRTTRNYLNALNQRFLENTSASIQYQTERSTKNVLNAYTSASGVTLMARTPASAVNQMVAMRDIDYFLAQDPLIDSVYFYNAGMGEVYWFGNDLAHGPLANFFDTDFANWVLTGEKSQSSPFPRTMPATPYGGAEHTVISRFFRMGNGDAVLINLDCSNLFGVLKNDPAVFASTPTNFLVCYGQSRLAYTSLYHRALETAGQNELLSILERHSWKTSFTSAVGGSTFDFSLYQDPSTDCQIISIIRTSDVTAGFRPYQVLFLVIAVGGCLLAILITFPFSTRLYTPIGKLKNLVPQGPADAPSLPQGKDEIEYIAHRITETTNRLENLFEYKEHSLALSQVTLLKRQFLYNQYSSEQFWEQCAQQELPYRPGDRFILICAHWHPTKQGAHQPPQEQRLLCYALGNVFHEVNDPQFDSHDLPFDADGIAFLCHFRADQATELDQSVLVGIQTTFRQYFELSLTFVISSPLSHPDLFYTAMQQLEELAHYQYFHPDGCLLQAEQLNPEELRSELPELPDMAALEATLREGDAPRASALCKPYFAALPQCTWETARASVNMLASKLITALKRLQASQPAFPEINYHQLFANLTGAVSLAEVQELLTLQFETIAASLNAPGNEPENLMVEEVLRYLEQNYADYNLSSKRIAQHYHVSVPYLNRIFKQKSGEPIASYVKKLRVEHARQLLVDTNLSVEAIARKVGFENTKYFYTIFKAEYGDSPSSYRISGSILNPPAAEPAAKQEDPHQTPAPL